MRVLPCAAFAGLVLCLAGCGFQLQGAFTVPEAMARTYIDGVDRYSAFYLEFGRSLEAAGVELVESVDAATAVFSIVFDDTGQRVLSVTARNTPAEFEVYYTIEYTLTSAGRNLLSSQELTLTRDYTYDQTRVLGKAREAETLRTAIVDDLVAIVLKQLGTLH